MDWYKSYKLVRDGENYTVIIDLNPDSGEFSSEMLTNFKENLLQLDDQINKLIEEKFSDIKVSSVKLALGAVIVASIPFMSHTKVEAAEVPSGTEQAIVQSTGTTVLDTTGVVTATKLNMRTGPGISYSIMHILWQGNRVKVIGEQNGWYEIKLSDGRTGWVSKSYLQVALRQEKINTIISTAEALIGTPYVWGGTSLQDGGFDCSGFTKYVFSQAGITLDRLSVEQSTQGTAVSYQNLQPGDLVFFSISGNGVVDHVGIYIGNGRMIHSPKTGDTVKVADVATAYWQSHFVIARRMI